MTAAAEVLTWRGLESVLPVIAQLHWAVLLFFAVLIAALGALLGGWVEYLIRRLFIAPHVVIDEQGKRLAAYEEGPKFLIGLVQPVTVAGCLEGKDGSPTDLMCIVQIRVTNEGRPGAALDWLAWIEFENGDRVTVDRITSENHLIRGTAQANIPRGDLIWERTATTIDQGETRHGYFLGILPLGLEGRLGEEKWRLQVLCSDYRGRLTETSVGFAAEAEGVRRLAEPTLAAIQFEPKQEELPATQSTPDSEAPGRPEAE